MARGAEKYGEENWRQANDNAALTRFRASALRHLFQYLEGDTSEDHCVAVAFNLAGAEMVREKLFPPCCGDCLGLPCICDEECLGKGK